MAKLSVIIGGDDRSLQAALKRSRSSMKQFRRELRAGLAATAKFAAGAVAVGAAVSIHMVKKSLAAIDAQAKMAQQMRTTVASMATLERASELSGVSLTQLESAGRNLSVRLGDAATGSGAAADALKRLGLTAEEVAALPLDERIALVNRRIRENIPVTEQAAIASDLFGRRAGLAIQQLDPETIRQAAEEAELFGTALSDIDAKQVELANDSMSRISMAVDGFFRQVTIQVAPALKLIGDRFFEAAQEAGGMGNIATHAMGKIVGATGVVLDAMESVKRSFLIAADSLVIVVSKSNAYNRAMEGNIEASEEAAKVAELARENQVKTMSAPMPSSGLEEMWERVKEQSREAADEVISARGLIAEGVEAQIDIVSDKESDAIDKRLERLRESFLTEEEMSFEHWDKQNQLIAEGLENQRLTEEEARLLREEAEQAHWERIGNMRRNALSDLEKFTESSFVNQAKTITGELRNITAGITRHNKAAFQVNKVAGIANAIINAHEGITKTMASYPYPLNIAMAAAHAAAAFAQVSAIRSQSFGSGGAAPSLAGSTPATPVTPVTSGTPTRSPQTINLNLQGEIFGRKTIIDFIDSINDAIADGARIRVT